MRLCISCLLLLVLIATGVANAGEAFDPAARAETIAPLIDETTFVVVHLDCSRIEVDPLLEFLSKLIPDVREADLAEAREQLSGLRDSLIQEGTTDLYIVINMTDLPDILVATPFVAGAKFDTIASFMPTPSTTHRFGNLLVMGNDARIEQIKQSTPDPRPELAAAFEAAGDTAAQALLIPPKYTARVIEEMIGSLGELLYPLPPELAETPSSVITEGVLWAALGADLEPEPSLRMVIQSKDEEAAGTLCEKWTAFLEFLGDEGPIHETFPQFDELASLITPVVEGNQLVITLDEENQGIDTATSLLSSGLGHARAQARQTVSIGWLKQIGLAMYMFHEEHKSLPAAANYDDAGKPLLSWRVHILPYLGEEELYQQFHLDEPWDSEHNQTLIERMPAFYKCPSAQVENGRTVYLVPVGEETVFSGREGISLDEIEAPARTILVVEADDAHAVVWTKPEDLPFDPDDPAKGLGQGPEGEFCAVYADGHVESHKLPQEPEALRVLFTSSGGEDQ